MSVEGALALTGVVLAVPGIIDLCIKYGSFLQEKYTLYQRMDADMKLFNLISNLVNGEMNDVLMFFKSVDDKLSPDLQGQIKNLLIQLLAELDALKGLITKDPGIRQRLGYSARKAQQIQKKCFSLEEWHVRFLRRATVLMLFGNFSPATDSKMVEAATSRAMARIQRIRGAIMGPDPDKVILGQLPNGARLHQTSTSSAMLLVNNDGSHSIAEIRGYGSASDVDKKNAAFEVIKALALRLAWANPKTMGMLRSDGFYDDTHYHRFILQFPYPDGMKNPRTLQNLLTDTEHPKDLVHSLTDRVNLAKKVTSGLLFVHAAGFLHKKVNPTSIVVFERKDEKYPDHLGEPFLVGYDSIRKVDHASARLKVEDWKENIYLHPVRHRLQPGDEFTALHDIYSLGVVLLEIACWSSFADRKGIGKHLWISETAKRDGEDVVVSRPLTPDKLKEQYLRLAKKRIPPVLGTRYCEVVVSCLEGLPDEDGTLPPSIATSDSSYIQQVIGKLEEIYV
ncbi:hypothetical protein EPUS_08948 [Endocarpon pusillum Z07020]|uniref:Protein kinase domain-containing protein n=1 Tax=Endocarpon pusillum (strain Z07020 / HMAS-L-300199) TaxID=1263415 RepID=U1GAJ4_ENDPU|nr:uncharacterized protein EPUS_08948 [Endocarpon pusillum Z07020]ERF74537.1 hypothetical protein EPUS_08948 [Endocarpon pusillum Z07020]